MLILGNRDLLRDKKAVILNSSQSKIPCGNDPWIRSTSRAIRYAIDSGYSLVSSLGLNTWEFCVHLAAAERGRQIIICPDFSSRQPGEIFADTISNFSLDDNDTAMIFAVEQYNKGKPKANWTERDRMAVELADLVFPVSVRPGGKMDRLIEISSDAKVIRLDYEEDYRKPKMSPPKYDLKRISGDSIDSEYITHWTRTCHGPWPGQSRKSYYSGIIASGDSYPNDAFATIRNIISEKRIRASSKRIRGRIKSVAFTESGIGSVLSQIRWLPKRSNWNFEPYGIAIRKERARRLGIRPVIYGTTDDYDDLSDDHRPYFQSTGSKDADWSREREWRHIGDFDFTSINEDDIRYTVYLESEAEILRQMTSSPVIALM